MTDFEHARQIQEITGEFMGRRLWIMKHEELTAESFKNLRSGFERGKESL
jgi:hypothetical protein